jgi:prepilin-type N-terminal cleavage/methylation domain-containing protein
MKNQSGKWKVESGNANRIDRSPCVIPFPLSHFPFRPAKRFIHSRLGVTLIELLIAIAIIATLSALFLGASRAAMESSRASRTKTTILKLHTLLMEQWASYETRRVDLDPDIVAGVTSAFGANPQQLGNAMHDLRVLALRELMKFEMPDRWTDIELFVNAQYSTTKDAADRDDGAVLLESVPTIARSYYRRYKKAYDAYGEDKVYENQSAECLYMTIMLMTGDGEARTMFAAQDIGDIDEDGLPEFLDGWGRPIEFLRWAPGFVVRSSLMSGDTDSDHDPFDPFRRSVKPAVLSNNIQWPQHEDYPGPVASYVDSLRGGNIPSGGQVGFRLVPLIFSSGPDGIPDIVAARAMVMCKPSGPNSAALNPYFPNDEDDNYSMGGPISVNNPDFDGTDESIDNITNHLIDGR